MDGRLGYVSNLQECQKEDCIVVFAVFVDAKQMFTYRMLQTNKQKIYSFRIDMHPVRI